MNSHKKQDKINKQRSNVLNESKKRYDSQGISDGLSDLKYKLKKIEYNPLYTRIFVDHAK